MISAPHAVLCYWHCRSLPLDETSAGKIATEVAESPDRVLELKEKLEEELLLLGEEQYDGIWKKKEQQATEVLNEWIYKRFQQVCFRTVVLYLFFL